jgi:hypothetical protein
MAALAGAQTITNTAAPVVGYLDLQANGGTPVVPPPTLGSEHNIVTTVGNPMFPAGNVRISNSGVAVAGPTSGDIDPFNVAIPLGGPPAGIPSGGAAVLPWWDVLCTTPAFPTLPAASVLWKESNGVLYIAWIQEWINCGLTDVQTVTFEIQVFGAPGPGAPWLQIFYPDSTFFSPALPLPPPLPQPDPCNNGGCATIGYVAGPSFGKNAQWSFATSSVPSGTVLSIFPTMELTPSSPLGPGSLKLDITFGPPNGAYFFAVTLAPGAYPQGWFFGLDISYADLGAQLSGGPPFSNLLGASGDFSLGPFSGVPPLTFYAIALGFPPGSPVPSVLTSPISYTIP